VIKSLHFWKRRAERCWQRSRETRSVRRELAAVLLRRKLTEFEIRTVQEEGWGALKNGDLLPDFNSEFSNALLKKFISRSRKSGLAKSKRVLVRA